MVLGRSGHLRWGKACGGSCVEETKPPPGWKVLSAAAAASPLALRAASLTGKASFLSEKASSLTGIGSSLTGFGLREVEKGSFLMLLA
jgi:hypothetical protein